MAQQSNAVETNHIVGGRCWSLGDHYMTQQSNAVKTFFLSFLVATKKYKAEICLWVGLNLRLMVEARQQIRQKHRANKNNELDSALK